MDKNNTSIYLQNSDNASIENILSEFILKNLINATISTEFTTVQTIFQIAGSHISNCTPNTIIMGSGINDQNNKISIYRECHIVRGNYTLAKIANKNQIKVGDPGLILSFFITKKPKKIIYSYGIILDQTNITNIKKYFAENILTECLVIDILNNNLVTLANKINSCGKIITNSLYGLIFSHSLGKSTYWLKISTPLNKDIEFYDYFSAFGINNGDVIYNLPQNILSNKNINTLKEIKINSNTLKHKKKEIFEHILAVLKNHNYSIKHPFVNNTYDEKIACNQLIKEINSIQKFFIGRIGGVELDAYVYYKSIGFDLSNDVYYKLFTYCGYYDKKKSPITFSIFAKEIEKYYNNCTLLMVANCRLETYYRHITTADKHFNNNASKTNINYRSLQNDMLKINKKPKIKYILDDLEHFKNFFVHFNNKKILIISPFEKEIKQQLQIKDRLFIKKTENVDFSDFKYPSFAKVEYINMHLTTNSFETPHNNIIETAEYYKNQIKTKDFDIALLICGAYAYILANYIYNDLHKSCIHVGGIGQIYFGIKGGRYMDTYHKNIMNDEWIFPLKEVKNNADKVPKDDGLLGYFRRK